MTGTGLGTETCRIATSDSSFSFNFSLPKLDLNVDLSGLNAILADSALVRLPKEWIQALTSMWVSVKTFAQSIITHISDLFSYVGRQITKIVNEYVIGYAKAAVETINTYIIMPVIRGVTNYIIEPIKSVLRQVVGFKDSSISVLKTILREVAGIGSTVYDYTIGALIAGFDQIPNGIILFVEGIQWLLNNLKHGIIGGANMGLNFMTQDVLNPLTSALFEAAKGAVSATQWTVDGVLGATDSFVNFFVDNLLNPVGGVVNDVLSYDLGTGVRSGVNTLIDGVNYIYDRAVVPIVNPIIGVVQTVSDGTVGAINAVSELDITGWIPEIDLGFTTIDIPSVRPFSWIPNLESPSLGTLNPSPIGHLTTDDIPVFHIADSIGTLSPIGHLNLVGMVGNFAEPANVKLTGMAGGRRDRREPDHGAGQSLLGGHAVRDAPFPPAARTVPGSAVQAERALPDRRRLHADLERLPDHRQRGRVQRPLVLHRPVQLDLGSVQHGDLPLLDARDERPERLHRKLELHGRLLPERQLWAGRQRCAGRVQPAVFSVRDA
jgi:hypothetical protein